MALPRREEGQPASELIYWIASVAHGYRLASGLSVDRLSKLTTVTPPVLSRFERGMSWPNNLDELLAAYGAAGGLDDPRQIIEEALEAWAKEGDPPMLPRGRTVVAQELGLVA